MQKKGEKSSHQPEKHTPLLPQSSNSTQLSDYLKLSTLLRGWHFPCKNFPSSDPSRLNECSLKLNLPFLKGYSPNKMNRKMPLVHINVILPSSKSVLITTFKEAAQLNRRK